MNLGLATLPSHCEVLVVGAGPAGSAAAQLLARAGKEVVLIDRHAFPRDKVCGDGLIADAQRALERLGVSEAVRAEARWATTLGCVAPGGGRIDVPGRLAVLPRKRLDEIVCRAAVDAGARMAAPVRFVAPIREAGRVVGATLAHDGVEREIRCRWLLLASGAQPQALLAAGLCARRTPSGVAMRGYVRHPPMEGRVDALEVVWHRRLLPGYGWIFPCGDGVFNVGVGVAGSGRRGAKPPNLRDAFAAFQQIHPPARELAEQGQWEGGIEAALKGAPLRCSLEGATVEAPGVLVCGEAAGSTYALTGEGIGKAMETGMLAAEAIAAHDADRAARIVAGDPADAAVRAVYAAGLRALQPRFDLYQQAHRATVDHPWTVDLLVWSAKRSPRRVERMAGVLEETWLPRDALSVRGVLRRLFVRR